MTKMKKILAMALVLVLVVCLSVAGTMAYLQFSDGDVNTMTMGNVKIEQNEQQRDTDDGNYVEDVDGENVLEEFQDQKVRPAVFDDYSHKDDVAVNDYTVQIRDQVENYVDKIVSVKNTGTEDSYVRTIYAFPEAGDFDTTWNSSEQWLHWNAVSDTDTNPNNGWIWGRDKTTEWPGNTDKWDVVENVTIDGKKYDIYIVTNKNVLEAEKSTAPSLLGFYIDPRVNCEFMDDGSLNYTFTNTNGTKYNLGDISTFEILVLSQAVQSVGFDDAWTALDTAFGDVTAENAETWFEALIAENNA